MRRVCVFCGSSNGQNKTIIESANFFGRLLAKSNLGLVYGGGGIGLMGIIADAVLDAGGEVIGVLPDWLAKNEVAHEGLTQMHLVKSMHERKKMMYELSDAFVCLPGGMGTMDELFEILTWAQLDLHNKPCAILNIDNYYDHLLAHFKQMENLGFVSKKHSQLLYVTSDPEEVLRKLNLLSHSE